MELPIALSRGKIYADFIQNLSKDSEIAATQEEKEAVASLSLEDLKSIIFFHYMTWDEVFESTQHTSCLWSGQLATLVEHKGKLFYVFKQDNFLKWQKKTQLQDYYINLPRYIVK
jgi:hypothetical protein